MSWTKDKIEQLKALWADGLSAERIAGKLGGITRNAVIGKVHRLGLAGRAKSPQRKPTNIKRLMQKPAQRVAPKWIKPRREPPCDASHGLPLDQSKNPVTLRQLASHHCHWPLWPGDPGFRYCGDQKLETSSYCARHAKAAARGSEQQSSAARKEVAA